MKTINNITVIGTGNVALQFSKLFLKNKFKIDGIYGRSNFSDSQIDNHLYTDKVGNISKNSDLYLVAVSDDAYLELLKNIPLKNKFIVHTSGSLVSEMLNSFSKRWGCLYPLQTIKKNQLIEWDNIPFFIEASNNNDLEGFHNGENGGFNDKFKFDRPIKVFGNLPYNISTKILTSMIKLENLDKLFSNFSEPTIASLYLKFSKIFILLFVTQ